MIWRDHETAAPELGARSALNGLDRSGNREYGDAPTRFPVLEHLVNVWDVLTLHCCSNPSPIVLGITTG